MLSRSLWAVIVALLIATGIAHAAPAGDVSTCLRDSRNRYAGPGDAANAQYSDSAGACTSGVQVTISGTGGGTAGGPAGPSPSAASSGSGATSSAGGSPAAPTSSGSSASRPSKPGSGTTGGPPRAATTPASAAATVRAALARGDSASVAAAPGAWSHAPTWLLVLGGGALLAIGAGVAVRVLRPGR